MEENKDFEMGLITRTVYGYSDNQGVGLLMEVRILQGAAQLFLPQEAVTNMLTELKIGNIEILKGAPCVVSVGEDKIVRFERLL